MVNCVYACVRACVFEYCNRNQHVRLERRRQGWKKPRFKKTFFFRFLRVLFEYQHESTTQKQKHMKNIPYMACTSPFHGLQHTKLQALYLNPVYTIQPVVKPVVKRVWRPVWQPCWTNSGCSNRVDNGFDNRLYSVHKRLSNGFDNWFDNRLYRVNGALM